ncbi:hypothetical protein [Lysinibacillus parviboronicapiens]|uniref:DUF4376 domain-containing protein n=1 Tax=Lysinibacillus parviboronicapiens TaxID=436516 RepID=UPI000D3B702D|nr:hypothetical protein [Lysinibacillus parviboronicapiens]
MGIKELKDVVMLDGEIINVGKMENMPEGALIEKQEMEYTTQNGWRKVKSLNEQKVDKINELKIDCQTAIFQGFTVEMNGESFYFGFNELDQMNFTQQLILIVSGDQSKISWKTNKGVKVFTTSDFMNVIDAGKNHKLLQQSKYWSLEQQVVNAKTIIEVDAIVW